MLSQNFATRAIRYKFKHTDRAMGPVFPHLIGSQAFSDSGMLQIIEQQAVFWGRSKDHETKA
jgi:hypothetical protein